MRLSSLAPLAVVAVLAPLTFGCRRSKPVAAAPPPWMDARIAEVGGGAAPGSEPFGSVYRGVAHSDGERTDWKISLEPGKCYWFAGVGDESVRKIALYLWDPSDSRITQDRSGTSTSVISACVEQPGMYRFQAKVTDGVGHYGVGIFSKDAPPRAAPPPPPPPPPKEDLGALVEAEASAVAPGAERVGNYFTGSAEKSDWYTALDAGSCYWFVGVGGAGVKELFLYLWDPKDKRITENRARATKSNMGHCPTVSGMYHFQAKVNSGDGEYAVGVYAKKK